MNPALHLHPFILNFPYGHHPFGKKNIRKTVRQTARNRAVKSRLKTLRKGVMQASSSGDAEAARQAAILFVSAVDKAAKTKVIHRNAARRMKSACAKYIFI